MHKNSILLRSVAAIVFFLGSIGNAQSTNNLVFTMSGDKQNPAVTTKGYGAGWAKVDLQQRKVTYAVAFDSLTGPPTAAHFHLGQEGVNGPPLFAITFDANGVASGELTNLHDTTLAHFLKGRIYCNIHTSAHGSGEIRGQVEYAGPLTFTILASGANHVPPVVENGKMVGFAVLSNVGTITVYGVAKGLTGPPTMAHLHYGAAGQSGSPAITLAAIGSLISGGGLLPSDSTYRKLLAGELYFNVHTSAHGSGELRGQVMGSQFYPFWTSMSGTQADPPNASTGQGFFLLRYNSANKTIEYGCQISGLTNVTGAHIHAGAFGQSGNVMVPIPFEPSGFASKGGEQAVMVADSVLRRLTKLEAYVNVHTQAFAGGEIRGQLSPAYNLTSIAFLDGMQQVPANNSTGAGLGAVMFPTDPGQKEMYFSLLVGGLSGAVTVAHIHKGVPGQSGSPIIDLQITTDGLVNTVEDSIMIQLLRGGGHYMNVHTAAFSGGEIRGDIIPIDGTDSGPNKVVELTNGISPNAYSLEQNFPNPFNPTTTIRFSVPVSALTTVKVFDILGKEIATLVNGEQKSGQYEVQFNASSLSTGLYFYQMKSGNFVETKKMLLMK
ncbi:MAG: CHRD domain-containing protein [Bacteroidota bacterium]